MIFKSGLVLPGSEPELCGKQGVIYRCVGLQQRSVFLPRHEGYVASTNVANSGFILGQRKREPIRSGHRSRRWDVQRQPSVILLPPREQGYCFHSLWVDAIFLSSGRKADDVFIRLGARLDAEQIRGVESRSLPLWVAHRQKLFLHGQALLHSFFVRECRADFVGLFLLLLPRLRFGLGQITEGVVRGPEGKGLRYDGGCVKGTLHVVVLWPEWARWKAFCWRSESSGGEIFFLAGRCKGIVGPFLRSAEVEVLGRGGDFGAAGVETSGSCWCRQGADNEFGDDSRHVFDGCTYFLGCELLPSRELMKLWKAFLE